MDVAPVARPASWRALAGRARRILGGVPLRLRLIGAMLLLVAIALVGSGAAATETMRNYLIGKVDQQLAGVAQHAHDIGDLAAAGSEGPPTENGERLPSEFVTEVLGPTGAPIAPMNSYLVYNEPLPSLPRITAAQSVTDGPRYFVVPAKTGGEQWRVYSYPVRFSTGEKGTVLVSQSLSDVDNSIAHLDVLLFVIGAVSLLVVAAAGYLIIRASLRPLRSVETAAARIAGGDLSHRVPQPDPRTEVGHLAGALNTMLARIETAFTERAQSEQAARESSERAQRSEAAARQSEERMRRFVADASHELRTPLTTVRGFAELYRQGAVAEGEDTRQLLARIESEAQRMGVLVEDLLMLARLDQERPLARDPVDMLAIANDAVHTAQALAPERTIRLTVGSIDLPPIVIGDDTRLRQVVGNLLTNAVKYSPAHSPVTVGVSTGPGTRSPAPVVAVTVSDQGPGLAPDDAARVFERFYRADRARNRNDGGAGLGLAIVSAIVAGHGGHVGVDTAPGKGATFRVELPCRPA